MILTLGNPYLLSAHTINLGMATKSKQLWPQSSRENLLGRVACFSLNHTCGLGWKFSFRLVYSCTFFDDFFKMPHFGNAPFPNEILGLQLPLGSVLRNALFLTSIYNCLSLVLISGPLGSLFTPTVIGKGSRLPLFFIRFRVNPGPQGQRIGSSVNKTSLTWKIFHLDSIKMFGSWLMPIDKVVLIQITCSNHFS